MSLNFGCKEQCSKLLQYQPNTYHLVNSSVKNIKPAFAGKCIAVAVACVEKAAEPKQVRRQISFPTKNRVECTCQPYWRSSCEIYTCHCQGSEKNENLSGKWAAFGVGVTASFVASLPTAGSGDPASLCRGSCNVGSRPLSIPEGVRSCHHGCGRFMGASSYCLSHGWWTTNQKHCKNKVVFR
jgi:hypothetical protein